MSRDSHPWQLFFTSLVPRGPPDPGPYTRNEEMLDRVKFVELCTKVQTAKSDYMLISLFSVGFIPSFWLLLQ